MAQRGTYRIGQLQTQLVCSIYLRRPDGRTSQSEYDAKLVDTKEDQV